MTAPISLFRLTRSVYHGSPHLLNQKLKATIAMLTKTTFAGRDELRTTAAISEKDLRARAHEGLASSTCWPTSNPHHSAVPHACP
jgi:hypothetical protein